MKAKFCLLVLAVFMASFFIGCKTVENTVARFSVVSSKNVDISNLGNFKRDPTKIETKKLNKITLFKESEMGGNYIIENALDAALETIPGATVMVDAKLKYIIKVRPFSRKYGYVFEGTALIDPSLAPKDTKTSLNILNDESELYFIEENGIQKQVSKDEYETLVASL